MARPKQLTPNYRLRENRLGIFEVHWTANGNTRKATTGTRDRQQAEQRTPSVIASAQEPVHQLRQAGVWAATVKDVCDQYEKAREKEVAAPVSMRAALKSAVDFFGAMMPSDITDSVVKAYARHRQGQKTKLGRPPSDGTIKREVGTLRTAIHWAARNKLIPRDVDIKMPVEEPPPRDRWITKREAVAIIDAAAPHIALFMRIALATAARRAAILELTWDRVHLPDAAEALLPGPPLHDGTVENVMLVGRVVLDMGKGRGNKRRAQVPLGDNEPLYMALLAAKRAAKTPHVIEFRGKAVADVKTGLEKACKRAKVPVISAHTLKHTSVSWMIQAGVSFDDVSALVGTSPAILRKVYGHLSPDHMAKIGSAVTV